MCIRCAFSRQKFCQIKLSSPKLYTIFHSKHLWLISNFRNVIILFVSTEFHRKKTMHVCCVLCLQVSHSKCCHAASFFILIQLACSIFVCLCCLCVRICMRFSSQAYGQVRKDDKYYGD